MRSILAVVTLVTMGLAACAPQSQTSSALAPAQAPAQGMQGHSMSGMNHQAMMAHCAEMRGQMRQGQRMSADMQQMMAECDRMNRSMGTQRGQ